MKKYFLIFLALFFIACGNSSENSIKNSKNSENNVTNATCDVNKNECPLLSKNGNINATLLIYPKPLITMAETTFKFSGLPKLKAANVRIYGLNMDMGTIKAELEKSGSVYAANIIISACVESVMKYRLEVLDGDKEVAYIDFDVQN